MKIQPGSLVELSYRISGNDGEVFDSSDDDGPMVVEFGSEDLPPALEEALAGKEAGAEVEVAFEPGEAFGAYNPDGVVALAKSDFPEEVTMEVGECIAVTVEDEESGASEELEMRVLEIHEDSVILDANHPLANKALNFWVRVETVREE
ncbi:MAG: FKBP-type peptidyl-prolyl cis-trans isomerase 2 [Chlamydiales bacterium]